MDTRVYLRHVTTRLYFSGWGSWSPDPNKAENLQNVDNAFHKARMLQLPHVEVVILDGDSATEKVLPIVKPGI
jgi:hypothetical protein